MINWLKVLLILIKKDLKIEMQSKETIQNQYEELKSLLLSIEVDLLKNLNGNKSAGVRARKVLREVKKQATDIIKNTIAHEKE